MAEVRPSIDIGSCDVLWTRDGGSEVNLGLTAEGVEIEISETDYDVRADGISAPLMSVKTETEITGEIELIEFNLDNIAVGLRSVKTTVAGPPAKESVDISPLAGEEVPFGKLVFHPRRLPAANKSKDVTIPMAILRRSGNRVFRATQEGRVTFSFQAGAKQDPTTGEWYPLYIEGDASTDVMFDLSQ